MHTGLGPTGRCTASLAGPVADIAADFADPEATALVVDAVVETFGGVDAVAANHARSSGQNLAEVTGAVNASASVRKHLAPSLGAWAIVRAPHSPVEVAHLRHHTCGNLVVAVIDALEVGTARYVVRARFSAGVSTEDLQPRPIVTDAAQTKRPSRRGSATTATRAC